MHYNCMETEDKEQIDFALKNVINFHSNSTE